jgi:hypothetical protein
MNSRIDVKDHIRTLKNEDGSITTDGLEIANILNIFFSSVFVKENTLSLPNIADIVTEDCINPTFDANNIEKRLKKLNIKSTDYAHPRVLKECARSLAKPFSINLNTSYLVVNYLICGHVQT